MSASFLILFLAFTGLMGLIPFVLRKFQIPQVISLLLVGMLIGPGLNMVEHIAGWLSFLGDPNMPKALIVKNTADNFQMVIDSLGSLGLMLLMALAGMEADFKLIRSVRKPVIALSVFTFLLPAIAGYWVYWYFEPKDLAGKLLYASLFASHSVGIVFPVMRELKLSKTRFGAAVLISTVVTDIASIILLAVSVQLHRQSTHVSHMVVKGMSIFDHVSADFFGNSVVPVFLGIVIVYLVVAVVLVTFIGKWLNKIFQPGEDVLITFVILVILATVIVGELLGINLVVGAFIAGLGLSQVVQQRDMLLFRRMESIGYGFLIPFLFVSIGMEMDFTAFGASNSWMIVILTVLGLIISKVGSGFIAMRSCGFNSPQG
ncbi:MAG: cation:proton antiporter, partial [Lentisphaeria bacterium]|nr:cation:proton antiporter [Lentisphaeria bacterium]